MSPDIWSNRSSTWLQLVTERTLGKPKLPFKGVNSANLLKLRPRKKVGSILKTTPGDDADPGAFYFFPDRVTCLIKEGDGIKVTRLCPALIAL